MRLIRAVYYAFLLSVPIETIDFFGKQSDSRIVDSSRLLALVLLLLAMVNWRRCLRVIPKEFWPICWYLAAYTASVLWIPQWSTWNFFRTLMMLYYGATVYLISVNLFADEGFRDASLEVYGWWAAIVGVAMLVGAIGTRDLLEDRASILGQNPDTAASMFAAGVLCIVANARFASKGLRVRHLLAPLAVAVLIVAILRTGSRGGLLALIAGVAALGVSGGRATRRQRVLVAAGVLGCLGLFVAREFQRGTDTATRLSESWTTGDTAGRDVIFAAAWQMFGERPLTGYGGAYNDAELGLRLEYSRSGTYNRSTHNLALEVLTEVGVLGGLPFLLVLLWAVWKAGRHARRTGDALPFALMCAQLTMNMSGVGTNESLFWIALAAATAVS